MRCVWCCVRCCTKELTVSKCSVSKAYVLTCSKLGFGCMLNDMLLLLLSLLYSNNSNNSNNYNNNNNNNNNSNNDNSDHNNNNNNMSFNIEQNPTLEHVKTDTSETKHLDSCTQHQNTGTIQLRHKNRWSYTAKKQTFYPTPTSFKWVRCFHAV